MVANKQPIFTEEPNLDYAQGIGTVANTSKVGNGTIGTDIFVAYTAGADGSFVPSLRAKPLGTNIQSLLRVFINNSADNTVAANNVFHADATLPATTNSETTAQPEIEIPLNITLDPGFRILVTVATAVAAGWSVSVPGGNY